MKKIHNCIKLNTEKFKRKRLFKRENLSSKEFKETFKAQEKNQAEIPNSNYDSRMWLFLWENSTTEFAQMNPNSKFYKWLFPIQFSSIQAFILELLQNNINYILTDRERIIQLICYHLKMEQNYLNKFIEDIQNLLIEYGKVKICENGKVVIMNDVW